MFRIFKTKNQEVIDIFKKIEDQLIIERKTNRIAKLYYDYNGEDRLEIRSSTFAYVLANPYDEIEQDSDGYISASKIHTVLGSNESNDLYKTIMVGSIICDSTKENIGIITDVKYDNTKNNTKIKISIIYSTKVITWNDYFD